jgi:hypothetical protein
MQNVYCLSLSLFLALWVVYTGSGGPLSYLSNEYGGFYLQNVKLTNHFHLLPSSGIHGYIHPLPIYLHGVVLN